MPLLTSKPQIFNTQLCQSVEACSGALQGAWQEQVLSFFKTAQGKKLTELIVADIKAGEVIYPATPFFALELTPLEQVKVVILGQDPYHGPQQAQGLAFSVSEQVKIPPSLRNMFKELQRDLGVPPAPHGSLVNWAKQGVLLLNTVLTVKQAAPASYAKKGWEQLTDALITKVAEKTEPVAFLLWGNHAQAKEGLIQQAMQSGGATHLILKSNHPSPLAALRPPLPFIGCGHFGAVNQFLKSKGLEEINW